MMPNMLQIIEPDEAEQVFLCNSSLYCSFKSYRWERIQGLEMVLVELDSLQATAHLGDITIPSLSLSLYEL